MKKPILDEEERIISARWQFYVLPQDFVETLATADATPSVANLEKFKSPAGATTVTNFLNGQSGQIISILGNGNLTVSNNANIKTNTGANKVLAANKFYQFMNIDNVWYEQA